MSRGVVIDKLRRIFVGGRLTNLFYFSVRAEAQRLIKEENVTILIALGHSGYELDMQMAAEIEELDVVVGGHSHTFLWPGKSAKKLVFDNFRRG